MNQARTAAIADLLRKTGRAHEEYERHELDGHLDTHWPDWYAEYLVEHDLLELVGAEVPRRELGYILKRCDRSYTIQQPTVGWHHYRIGSDRAEPPGPGVPITVVDSGLDMTHMEFSARPNTFLLNQQEETVDSEEYHGTMVSSTAEKGMGSTSS